MFQILVRSPEGEEIELVATEESRFCAGAEVGAKAMLDLLHDEMDLEDGYSIVVKKDGETYRDYSSRVSASY